MLYGILLNLAGVLLLNREELHCGNLARFKVFLISLHLHQMVASFLLGRSHVLILVIGNRHASVSVLIFEVGCMVLYEF